MRHASSLSPRERWLLANVAGCRLLDVGFAGQKGTLPGYFPLVRAARTDRHIFGVDWNQDAVVSRGQRGSLVGDASRLPIRKDSVDCVIMGEFLEHHVAIDTFLAESWRVLKPGGVLLITTPNPLFLNRLVSRWLAPTRSGLIRKDNVAAAMGYHDHRVLWDPLSLAHIVGSAGFHVDELCALGTWIPFLGRLIPRFRRSLLLDFWPANRLGYITCMRCSKSPAR
jgi:SAM-dependent methyltransferase